jgi:hypothetical protein
MPFLRSQNQYKKIKKSGDGSFLSLNTKILAQKSCGKYKIQKLSLLLQVLKVGV